MDRSMIGVDVSLRLARGNGSSPRCRCRFANDPAGVTDLVAWVREIAPERIVFESTGHYQKLAVGLPCSPLRCPPSSSMLARFATSPKGWEYSPKPIRSTPASWHNSARSSRPQVRPPPAPEIQDFQDLLRPPRPTGSHARRGEKSSTRLHFAQGHHEHRCPHQLPEKADQ